MDSEGIVIEGMHVVIAEGLPQGYAGVFEPGCEANPGPHPVILVDLDTYVRLDAGERSAVEAVTALAIEAKRGIKAKQNAQDRRQTRASKRLAHYNGPR